MESEREFHERNVESIYADRSPEAEGVRTMPYAAYAAGETAERIAAYKPTRRLIALARRRPRVAWLVSLPPEERAWHAEEPRRALLHEMFEEVTETEWQTLFRLVG